MMGLIVLSYYGITGHGYALNAHTECILHKECVISDWNIIVIIITLHGGALG